MIFGKMIEDGKSKQSSSSGGDSCKCGDGGGECSEGAGSPQISLPAATLGAELSDLSKAL